MAVASVALATILSNDGLQNELARSSRQRLAGTARHLAELAAELYAREGGFTAAARGTNRGVAAA